jgi:hypothetical protein
VNSAFSPNPDESVIDLYNVSLCLFITVCAQVPFEFVFLLLTWCWFGMCRTLDLMVNWWLTMLVPWHGAKTEDYRILKAV